MHSVLLALALLSGFRQESPAKARVLIFARTDCPLTDRYAPELRRLAAEFAPQHVVFELVYPDRTETASAIQAQISQYNLPGTWVRDPSAKLVKEAHVTVAPESAVFDARGALMYHGRIDNRWVDFGKARPTATEHDLEDAIRAVLAGQPVPHPETRAIGCSLADVE